jgi:hypothetical protein
VNGEPLHIHACLDRINVSSGYHGDAGATGAQLIEPGTLGHDVGQRPQRGCGQPTIEIDDQSRPDRRGETETGQNRQHRIR